MAKIMLVEDDNNLREIYEARLAAEGYEIVSAADGEAALALSIKEKPDLIIADIMMPKVSGFDMLDIMRSTTETKNAKIIMMTALNQAEDKAKAEKLGADLYLVKSQVTLEDVVRSAKKLLGEESPLNIGGLPIEQPGSDVQQQQPPAAQNSTSMTSNAPAVPQQPANAQATPQPAPITLPQPPPAQNNQQAPAPPQQPAPAPQPKPVNVTNEDDKASQQPPAPQQTANTSYQVSGDQTSDPKSAAPSAQDEEAALQKQIEQFISSENPTISTDPNAGASQPSQSQPPAPQPQTQPTQTSQPSPAPTPQPTAQQQPAPQPVPITPPQPPPAQNNQQNTSASFMAVPPSNTTANDPQTTNSSDDKPSGERVIQKSASPGNQEGGLNPNAAVSGRHKVIKPISDVLTRGPDLDALLAQGENSQPGTAPTVNSVVSPDGITSTPNPNVGTNNGNGGQVMSDIIAPNPSAVPTTDPNNPPAPPVA